MNQISVIIPFFNLENYLERCLESLVEQTYDNLEIILINDGSTDRSVEICKAYMKKDSRIKLLQQKHLGASDARNLGLNIAKGDFISFVDGDDYIEKNMFAHLMENSLKYNAEISTCNFIFSDNAGRCVFDVTGEPKVKSLEIEGIVVYDELKMLRYLEKGISVGLCGAIYKKSLFRDIFLPNDRIYEDLFIMHRVIENANRIVLSDKCLYHYIYREDSIVHGKVDRHELDMVDGMIERYYYLRDIYPEFEVKCRRGILEALLICVFKYCEKGIRDEFIPWVKEYCIRVNKFKWDDCGLSESAVKLLNILMLDVDMCIKLMGLRS